MAPPTSSFAFLLALLLLSTASATENVGRKYTYTGSMGPENWGKLDQKYTTCAAGKTQSPVDITKNQIVVNKNLTPITREYQPVNCTLFTSGQIVGIQYMAPAGEVAIDGKTYYLVQSHWHTPAEHKLYGVQHDAELHLVHKTKDKQHIAVVAILFQIGKRPDPFIAKFQNALTDLAKDKCTPDQLAMVSVGKLDLKQLRRNSRKYYRYVGSLTTPPCTENITWTILGKVRSISKEQVAALEAPLSPEYKKNSRPVQPLNGRQIQMYERE